MASQGPYVHPSLPFSGPIYGGLRDGLMVTVTGSVLQECTRFEVNFQCGPAQVPRPDVAFHFNPRFDEGGCVVWNSFERGSWQREERQGGLPFRRGQPFEIGFLVKSGSFMVDVNKKHYLEFKHRIPLSRVDTIAVSGGVKVACISFRGPAAPDIWPTPAVAAVVDVNKKHYLEFKHRIPLSRVDTIAVSGGVKVACISFRGPAAPDIWPTPAAAAVMNAAFPLGMAYHQRAAFQPGPYFQPQIYSVPYQVSVFGGLFPSKSIIVSGNVLPGADRFHINLKAGQDVAFHLNPRFNENAIVRNSKFNGQWGPEERHLPGKMPLHPGQTFTIWILCELKCFRVAVNGQHQFDYNHRVPNLQQIDWLEIEGSVSLSGVQT